MHGAVLYMKGCVLFAALYADCILVLSFKTFDAASLDALSNYSNKFRLEDHASTDQCLQHVLLENATAGYNFTVRHNLPLYEEISWQWQPWLQNIFPECWLALEPYLCRHFFTNWTKQFPVCRQLCLRAKEKCRMLSKIIPGERSKNLIQCRGLKDLPCHKNFSDLSGTSQCGLPLISTNLRENWAVSWEDDGERRGCGIPCESSILADVDARKHVKIFIGVLGSIALCCCFFNLVTFAVAWKQQNRYPAVILFFLNACFACCLSGWLLQFIDQKVVRSLLCRKDGTVRLAEVIGHGSEVCLLSFVLIYYGCISAAFWFVLLAYAWHISFKSLDTLLDHISGKVKYFHMLAWIGSFILTVIVLFVGQVDADPLAGICFIGYENSAAKNVLFHVPLITAMIVGETFLVFSVLKLKKHRDDSVVKLTARTCKNITLTIRRLGLYGFTLACVVIATLGTSLYRMAVKEGLDKESKDFLRCHIVCSSGALNPLCPSACKKPKKPDAVLLEVEFFSLFAASMVTASWTWTKATFRVWTQVWKRIRGLNSRHSFHPSWYQRMLNKRVRPLPAVAGSQVRYSRLAQPRNSLTSHNSIASNNVLEHVVSLAPLKMASWVLNKSHYDHVNNRTSHPLDELLDCSNDDLSAPFTGRRGTMLSVHSLTSASDPNGEAGCLERRLSSQSLHLHGPIGHLDAANAIAPPCRSASRRSSGSHISLGYLQELHDRIIAAGQWQDDHIVAGCMPSTPLLTSCSEDLHDGLQMPMTVLNNSADTPGRSMTPQALPTGGIILPLRPLTQVGMRRGGF